MDLNPSLVTRDRSVPLSEVGGFMALESPRSEDLAAALKSRGVLIDIRGTTMRLGPAPYLSDAQLTTAMDALGEAALDLTR